MIRLNPLVLVVDDEAPVRRFLKHALEGQEYQMIEAASAREALSLAAQHLPDAILLDLGLPDRDGVEVCRELRAWYRGAVVVVSARGEEASKVRALDTGADDYVTKPFGVPELLARLRAALRHVARAEGTGEVRLLVGDLEIDLAARAVRLGGGEVRLTRTEYRLLCVLARNPGRVVTQKQLIGEVWGPQAGDKAHDLRVHIANLRGKLEADSRPGLLHTELGVGYRLA